MSIAEIERFAADLKSNEALRAEAEKHAAERHHETPIAHCVSFAASKGYAFTADDVAAYAKSRKLSDAELDGVAGGAVWDDVLTLGISYLVEQDQAKEQRAKAEEAARAGKSGP